MSPHRSLKRFIRASKPDYLSEEERERIAAKRFAKVSPPSKRQDPEQQNATPAQLEARDHARLRALHKRQGRG